MDTVWCYKFILVNVTHENVNATDHTLHRVTVFINRLILSFITHRIIICFKEIIFITLSYIYRIILILQ